MKEIACWDPDNQPKVETFALAAWGNPKLPRNFLVRASKTQDYNKRDS